MWMLNTDQLLEQLKAMNVRNVDIARVLELPDSRVPEIRDKRRALKLDEAVKLVQAFGLESNESLPQPPVAIFRLVVRHVAARLGVPVNDQALASLAEDLRAFSGFVADPKVRRSVEMAEGYFHALQTRHQGPEVEAPPRTDPARNNH